MQFTQQEERLIKRLRKQDHQWQDWQRWMFLGLGVLMLAVAGFFFSELISLLDRFYQNHDVSSAPFISVLVPVLFTKLAIGVWLFAKALTDWHGNVNRMLLLKLLDAQQK